jgi:hypothetical protein
MKALESIWNDRPYQQEISYTDNIGLILQPSSFTDFHSHPDFVEAYRLFTQNDPFRGLDFARIWSMVLNIKYALTKCAGSLAELGVYQGQSSALLSFYARQFRRKIYLADTFTGFAEQQYEEGMGEGKQTAFKDVSLETARAIVGDYEGNRWIVGMFPNSITDEMREDTYAFVSIDCDIYEPIIEGLRFFWPRMAAGAIILIHDYSSGYWPGATRAVDEFCAQNGVSGCLLPDFAGSYVLTRASAGLKLTGAADAQMSSPNAERDCETQKSAEGLSGANAALDGAPKLVAERHHNKRQGVSGVIGGWPGLSRWFGGSRVR